MKAYVILLLLFPFFCLAQEDKTKVAQKPSTTDCPTWKKKDKKASKAEYFQYLRTAKPQSKTQTNYTTNSDAKVQSNTVQQRTKRTEQKDAAKPVPEKIRESTVIAESSPKNVKSTETISTIDKPAKSDKKQNRKEQEVAVTHQLETAPVALATAEDKKEIEDTTQEQSDKPKSQASEKLDEEKTKFKQKVTRLTRKTTKVRKRSNAKCPSF